MRAVALIAPLLALVTLGAASPGDRIELRTGEVIYGRVLRSNAREVSIQLRGGGILSFRRSQVRQVRSRAFPNEREDASAQRGERRRANEPEQGAASPRATSSGRAARSSVRRANPVRVAVPADDTGPTASTGSPEPAPLGDPILDRTYRFSIRPPASFVPTEELVAAEGVLHGYRDPLTRASLVIAVYRSDEPLVAVKKKVTHAYRSGSSGFRVLQDIPLSRATFEGWKVEAEQALGATTTRRLHLFVRSGQDIVIFTYGAPEEEWPRLERAIAGSVESLRQLDDTETPAGGAGDTPSP